MVNGVTKIKYFGQKKDTARMVDINRFIDETEKLSLLPDRLYLILKPVNDDKGV